MQNLELKHLDQASISQTQLTIDALSRIAPSCITEVKDSKTGSIKHAVDFKVLRQLLGDNAVEDAPEAYEFTWVGKQEARREAAKSIHKTLRPVPEDSVDWDNTQNIYIEGDNLEALKLLQKSYLGKVKMIYIDPPYNTGNDFVYHDDFKVGQNEYDEKAGNVDEEGNRLVSRGDNDLDDVFLKNTDTNGRFHSDWCSMIYSRLMIARSLLNEDGAIFISIDDRESDNMIKLCEEVFGETCFVGNISWQKTYSPRNDSKGIPAEKENIIVFSKNPEWIPNKLPRTAEMDAKYKNPDNDVMPWTSDNPFASDAKTHQGMVYAIQHPFTGELIYPYSNGHWRYSQTDMLNYMNGWCEYTLKDLEDEQKRADICGIDISQIRTNIKAIILKEDLATSKAKAEVILKRGQWPKFYFTKNGLGGIRRKTYLDKVEGKMVTNLWPYTEVGHTDEAKKELKAIFDGEIPFDTPKPVRLLDRIIQIATNKEDTILDFFSGSATTAHATMLHNSKDDGNRKFILVQLPESVDSKWGNLCEIGKERIRRAGAKIKEELANKNKNQKEQQEGGLFDDKAKQEAEESTTLDTGFRVFRIDSGNMKDDLEQAPAAVEQTKLDFYLDNVKDDRTELDLLFGCMLNWGVQLSLPMSKETVDGCNIYTVNDGDLVACLTKDQPITENIVKAIAEKSPLRVLFRDGSFASDASKINIFEQFKQLMDWSDDEIVKNVRVL